MKKNVIVIILISFIVVFLGSMFSMEQFEKHVDSSEGLLKKYEFKPGSDDECLEITPTIKESWPKEFPDGFDFDDHFENQEFADKNDAGITEGAGRTIEILVNNKSEYRVNRWEIEYTVPCDLFFDKAWNGTVEIHQFGDTNVDDVETKDIAEGNTTLKVDRVDELFLVPLAKGDKIIYHPADFEYPLVEGSVDEGEFSNRTIGLITYTKDHNYSFDNFTVRYYVVKSLEEYPLYIVLRVLSFISGFISLIVAIYLIVAIRYDSIHKHDREIISQAIGTFSRFIDSKDKYTNNHSYRVAGYSRLIANKLGLSDAECEDIYYIGLLHDIGKIDIDDKILNKPGRLTSQEYEVIKSHTTIGADLLKEFTAIKNIAIGALYHHERYDGKGYPSGLMGEDIPLVARIICVADSYDAMSSNRCYRKQLEKEEIVEQLVSNKDKQFDGKIVDLFLECIESGEADSVRRSCIES